HRLRNRPVHRPPPRRRHPPPQLGLRMAEVDAPLRPLGQRTRQPPHPGQQRGGLPRPPPADHQRHVRPRHGTSPGPQPAGGPMTPEEAVILARYVKAMCPQQRLDEYTADAWYDVLAPYPLEDARAAVARHVT